MSSRHKYIGTYRDIKGNIHKKYQDDENYVFIRVNYIDITIQGDGEIKSQEDVYKEIEEAKVTKPNKYQMMNDKEFKQYMNSRFR